MLFLLRIKASLIGSLNFKFFVFDLILIENFRLQKPLHLCMGRSNLPPIISAYAGKRVLN